MTRLFQSQVKKICIFSCLERFQTCSVFHTKKNQPLRPAVFFTPKRISHSVVGVEVLERAMEHKGLLKSTELYQYILETSVYPREPEPLKEIAAATASHSLAVMATAPDAGQMIVMLLKLINAKKTIEVGVFTGYSALLVALTIPADGKILAIDIDRQPYDEIGLPIIKRAGVDHKIDFVESAALPVLDKLLENYANEGSFDFAFVDADKVNYKNYHERMMKLLKVGGIVVYDNTLWQGTVAMPEESVPEYLKDESRAIFELNKSLAADSRILICHAPLGDGITICRRLY